MRVRFSRGYPVGDVTHAAGMIGDVEDDVGNKAIADGAAEQVVHLRFKRDHRMNGVVYPATYGFDVPLNDAARKAVADGAAEGELPAEKPKAHKAAHKSPAEG